MKQTKNALIWNLTDVWIEKWFNLLIFWLTWNVELLECGFFDCAGSNPQFWIIFWFLLQVTAWTKIILFDVCEYDLFIIGFASLWSLLYFLRSYMFYGFKAFSKENNLMCVFTYISNIYEVIAHTCNFWKSCPTASIKVLLINNLIIF